ncbi:helix-turn-helix domain-containing protein [Marinomonas transparens]|uniref:Helix-turn-helix transcriptional regulator n=1 Tax=Marinomonas transparens TaxID=2795388 RepID=A0A934N3N0_9GAMM|nr:helix-turn-helix transcriptional regulator [Marinomonas transparens]MBJ7539857.1 helix-turn-helix transcriptional regulator [Marinomonas transparens]
MSLGERLKAARKAKRLSRDDLARLLSRSPHTVKSWEIDKHAPPCSMLRKIEVILDKAKGHFSTREEDRLGAAMKDLALQIKALPIKKQEKILKLIENFAGIIS